LWVWWLLRSNPIHVLRFFQVPPGKGVANILFYFMVHMDVCCSGECTFFFLERKEKLTIIDIAICMSFLEIMPRIQFIVDRKGHVWLKHNPIQVSFLFFLIIFIIYLVINVKNHRS
jgi:uncharacterized membrane protein YtjA (UPF0391 family)